MFYNCPKLEYVNLKNLHFCNNNCNNDNFISASKNIVFCTECTAIRAIINSND